MIKNNTPRVYSYIRFSTPEQELGNSLRRQLATTRELAERKGLPFDDRLRDEGVSGYKGLHRTKGMLGEFLKSVELGDVVPGSLLVVENIDRLGREGGQQMLQNIIFKLWDHEITLVTTAPYGEYPPGSGNDISFLSLMMGIQIAHQSSSRKSHLLKESRKIGRQKAREEKVPLTTLCPNWLEVTGDTKKGLKMNMDRRYVVKSKAKKTLRLIFNWYLNNVGIREIEQRLNQRKDVWVPHRFEGQKSVGWRHGYLRKILTNRAVLGEYQPHKMVDGKRVPVDVPIEEYYPRVIDDELFFAAQESMARRPKSKGGRTGKNGNLFTGIIVCGYCGGPMRYENKGEGPKGGKRYVCDNGVRKIKCKRYTIRLDEVEELVLHNCQHLSPSEILPNSDAASRAAKAAAKRAAGFRGQVAEITRQISNLMDQMASNDNKRLHIALSAKFDQLDAQEVVLSAGLESAEQEHERLTNAATDLTKWRADFAGLVSALESPKIRGRAKVALRMLISKVELFTDGQLDNDDHLFDALEFWRPSRPIDKTTRDDFEKRLAARCKTKMGRCIRVHFATGRVVDLVPNGSLAAGMRLVGLQRKWARKRPDLDVFWKKFKKGNL